VKDNRDLRKFDEDYLAKKFLGTRVPKDLSEMNPYLSLGLATHDHAKAQRLAFSDSPNVYVRRARANLGIRPTGAIFYRDLIAMPSANKTWVMRVADRASRCPRPPMPKRDLWILMAGAAYALMMVASQAWGRK
jgi:hypothetical protein